jgi:hypothetical protein
MPKANGAIRKGCPVLFCYFIYYPMPQPFNLNGTYFDLSHLSPIKAKTIAKLRAGEKKVTVQLEFSCHCWSRKPAEGETIPSSHLVLDGSKEMPRNRIFCEGRYELSKALPAVIDKMLTSNGHIHKTQKKNIVRIDLVAPVVPGAPVTEYFVFMKLEKREPAGAQKYVRVFVESAYPENVLYDKVDYGKPFSFAQLIGDCWEGRYPK